jgi:hypothetical protein
MTTPNNFTNVAVSPKRIDSEVREMRSSLRRILLRRTVAIVAIGTVLLVVGVAHSRQSAPASFKVKAWFDGAGRPYDLGGPAISVPKPIAIGTFEVPTSPLLVGDGITVSSEFRPSVNEFKGLPVRQHSSWNVSAVMANGGVAVLLLQQPRSTVARWSAFEAAYGTDGGAGGLTSKVPIGAPGWQKMADLFGGGSLRKMRYLTDHGALLDKHSPRETYYALVINDADENGQFDTIQFNNGYGDGAYPLARGLDADGRLVAVAITSQIVPWRLAVTEGTPPPDVTREEDRIAKCPNDIYSKKCLA